MPVCHEWNTIAHLSEYEGRPEARPFTREELQRFLDYADDQVERAATSGRKGALAAYRDATLFKVIYGWGLRRTEASKLDLADWGRNPAAPEFGRYGMLHVRYGKAVRGQPPRRRNVAVGDGLGGGGGRGLRGEHPAAVRLRGPSGAVGDRAGRAGPPGRDQLPFRRLPGRAGAARRALTPHSLRHSWVTHLTEDGVDRRFIQEAVGHRCDTSTAIYTHVSGDFMNTALRKALAPALGQPG